MTDSLVIRDCGDDTRGLPRRRKQCLIEREAARKPSRRRHQRQDAAGACDILVLLVTAAAGKDEVRRPLERVGNSGVRTSWLCETSAGLSPEQFG